MRLSYSQIKTFRSCGRKYRYKYIENISEETNQNMLIGKVFDQYLTSAMKVFAEDADEDFQIYADNFKHDITEYINAMRLSDEDKEKALWQIKTLHYILPYYVDHFEYQPYLFQYEIKPVYTFNLIGDVEEDIQSLGYVDLVAKNDNDDIIVIDYKTSARSVSQPKKEDIFQVALYADYIKKEFNLEYFPAIELHYFIKSNMSKSKKKEVHQSDYIRTFRVDFDWNEMPVLIEDFQNLAYANKAGFFPMNRASDLCDKRWCAYYEHCHNTNGGMFTLI